MATTGSIGSVLKKVAKTPIAAETELRQLGAFEKADFEKDLKNLALSIRPVAVRELASAYNRSGVGKKTGTLYQACVTGIWIKPHATGFTILMQEGVSYGKGRANVYGSAGAKKYGGYKFVGAAAKSWNNRTYKRDGKILKVKNTRLTGLTRRLAIQGHVQGVVEMKEFPDFFEIAHDGPTVKAYESGLKKLLQARGIATNG